MKHLLTMFICILSHAAVAEPTSIAAYSCEGNERWIIQPTAQDGRFSFELISGKIGATRVMKGALSVGPIPNRGLVHNESGKAIGKFKTHGAEITAEIGGTALRCSEANQTLAVMIGQQTQRAMAERKRSATGRPEAVHCEAECTVSCEDLLFSESPDRFSAQKCKDYGGIGSHSGGNFVCTKRYSHTSWVYGYGQMTHEAQRMAYDSCQARSALCSQPTHRPSKSVGAYNCN